MTIGFLIITPDIFFFYIRYLSNHIRQIIKILKNGQQTEKISILVSLILTLSSLDRFVPR